MSDPKTIQEDETILTLSVYLDRVDYSINNQNIAALERIGDGDSSLLLMVDELKGIFENAHEEATRVFGNILSELFPEVTRTDATHVSRSTLFILNDEFYSEEVGADED